MATRSGDGRAGVYADSQTGVFRNLDLTQGTTSQPMPLVRTVLGIFGLVVREPRKAN
ncbi:hypothetical protein [uncultured Tateyamaria sp.]|uniref:hypothetical protein n=1 Tax=uncultured Tateyamaria sp. TaxID=455651 RepID=UPI00260EF9C8|nr:hypothetical protein [uncultured Tateyamaria sp.]